MSPLVTILGMAVVTYAARLAGLLLTGRAVPPFWLRFLRFVPIAVFAALVAPALPGERGEWAARLAAAGLAALATWRTGRLWAGLLAGMAAFWLLRGL